MASKHKVSKEAFLTQEWTLTAAATLGSSVRAKGILLEMRARLPGTVKKALDVRGAVLVLSMPQGSEPSFQAAAAVISSGLSGIEDLPIIPREIEEILAISTTERHRWLKDGRLRSAGTRTVKLRGRAKQITFHVYDPRWVEDVLDRDLVTAWREDDATTAAENRRLAAWKRRVSRLQKIADGAGHNPAKHKEWTGLAGWEAFEREGLLR